MASGKIFGGGILGNCCTHGAGLASMLANHPRVNLVAGYERNERRAGELAEAMGMELAASYQAVIEHPKTEILVVSTDPCDKAEMVEQACAAGKHVLLNKPFADSLDSARRVVRAVENSGVKLVQDIPMVKGIDAYARLRADVAQKKYGHPISYFHAFGMTFDYDFPIREQWPERFDPPSKAGGGEMTNMGCYALDYVVSLFGRPKSVRAKWAAFWEEYRKSGVENFGQIMLDYGDFYALLSVGKQQVDQPHEHTNCLSIMFPNTNLLLDPRTETILVNGSKRELAEFIGDTKAESSLDQLIRCIETGEEPVDSAQLGALGVEVQMAAYLSIAEDGREVALPLQDGFNPLVKSGIKAG